MNMIDSLRARMAASGKSQLELSALCGVPQSTIGRILRGEVAPRIDTMQRIEDGLAKTKKRRGRK